MIDNTSEDSELGKDGNLNQENKEPKPSKADAGADTNGPDKNLWSTIDEDPTKIHLDSNLSDIASGAVNFLKGTLTLRHGKYDYKKVVEDARDGVVFKGYNVWILVCSIIVASIGLNMDSVAVVIGAMLISPLMGPIRGIGFGVGMNDLPLLFSSLKNFGVMFAVSLATSILYFMVSPIDIATSELLGRTEPTFLDAMIAFFGGLAGIIAFTNGKNDTVISGVAIATALMPPLCTAGYGIANAEWGYFFGASYLFLLNSLFIALSTLVLLRYLKFPKREYFSAKIEKKVQLYIIIFLLVILTPSGYLFYRMTKKSVFEVNVIEFVDKVVLPTEEGMRVSIHTIFDFENSVIELGVQNRYIDSTTLEQWNRSLSKYDLEYAKIDLIQTGDRAYTDKRISESLNNVEGNNNLINLLKEKEDQLAFLRTKVDELESVPLMKKDPLEIDYLLKGYKNQYDELSQIGINRIYNYRKGNSLDTTYLVTVSFKKDISEEVKTDVKNQISKRFLFELKEKTNTKQDSVRVINFE